MSFKRFQDLLAVCFSVFFAGASGFGVGIFRKGSRAQEVFGGLGVSGRGFGSARVWSLGNFNWLGLASFGCLKCAVGWGLSV